MNKEIEKILVDIIKHDLDLPDNYGISEDGDIIPCIAIANQNIKLHNTQHIQIVISTFGSKVFSNHREYKEFTSNDETVLREIIDINEQRQMQIDVYSRNNEARQRFWEVQACLNSTYAQEQMDKYNFRLSKTSQATNTSGLDGGSDIYRYSIRFNCLTWQQKISDIDYYTEFRTTAQTGNASSTKFIDMTMTAEEQ